jgi:hypothetical protein
MKLFQASVFEQIRSDGVFLHLSRAEAVDVNGKLYADVAGNLYAADSTPRWHETEAAAREEAAVKVEAMAATLAAQAVRIREGGR